MARLRFNDVLGTVVTNAVSTNGRQLTWTSAPAFPSIAPYDYAVVILEPDTAQEEIVHLKWYTAGATIGFCLRNAEATSGGQNSAAEHTSVAWAHGPAALDFKSASSRQFARSYWR